MQNSSHRVSRRADGRALSIALLLALGLLVGPVTSVSAKPHHWQEYAPHDDAVFESAQSEGGISAASNLKRLRVLTQSGYVTIRGARSR
jgi:hypothetical protein